MVSALTEKEHLRFAYSKGRSTSKQQKDFPRLGTAARTHTDQINLLPKVLCVRSTAIII